MKPKVLVIDDEAAIRDSLRLILEYDHTLPVAIISGHGTVTDAMQATRLGAFDCPGGVP
jgi:DNA-binding NtrC family response regulator